MNIPIGIGPSGLLSFSNRITSNPDFSKYLAVVNPDIPPPITTTFLPYLW